MIDIHCHILPGVDDGAASDTEALEMLRLGELDGIDRIVATPHVPPKPGTTLTPEQILDRVDALNELVTQHGIPIEILAGSEIRLEPDIIDAVQQGEILTLNGSPYVLLELPLFGDWPIHLRSTIFDLQMAGYLPILAHVERYPAVQRDPTVLDDLIATGVLMQVNADSIVGGDGGRSRATARRLLKAHMLHLLASDAHSPRTRVPHIASAYARATELIDAEYVEWMKHASEAVINGEPILLPEPHSSSITRRWSRLWPRIGEKAD